MTDTDFTDPAALVAYLQDQNFPLAVLSRKTTGFFAAGVSWITKDPYGHFFWAISPTEAVSQDFPLLHRVPLAKFLRPNQIVKFVSADKWTQDRRLLMMAELGRRADAPFWSRLYDALQILGHFMRLKWLNLPGIGVCSDMGYVISYGDESFDCRWHPSPGDLNNWMKARQAPEKGGYHVVCRMVPEGF